MLKYLSIYLQFLLNTLLNIYLIVYSNLKKTVLRKPHRLIYPVDLINRGLKLVKRFSGVKDLRAPGLRIKREEWDNGLNYFKELVEKKGKLQASLGSGNY